MKIIKFALPLAAAICFSTAAPLAVAAESSSKKKSSSASAKKKSSSSKKSTKSKSSQSRKGKSKSSSAKKKGKSERRTAAKADTSSHNWIDELPEVELPTVSGPPEEELLEPVDTVEGETEADVEADPEP